MSVMVVKDQLRATGVMNTKQWAQPSLLGFVSSLFPPPPFYHSAFACLFQALGASFEQLHGSEKLFSSYPTSGQKWPEKYRFHFVPFNMTPKLAGSAVGCAWCFHVKCSRKAKEINWKFCISADSMESRCRWGVGMIYFVDTFFPTVPVEGQGHDNPVLV